MRRTASQLADWIGATEFYDETAEWGGLSAAPDLARQSPQLPPNAFNWFGGRGPLNPFLQSAMLVYRLSTDGGSSASGLLTDTFP